MLKTCSCHKYQPMKVSKPLCTDYGTSLFLQHPPHRQSLALLLTGFCVTSLPESQLLKEIFFTVMGYKSFSSPQRIVFKSFRITSQLWYQTFILTASFRENSFVLVCFGFFPDKKKQRSYDDFTKLNSNFNQLQFQLELSIALISFFSDPPTHHPPTRNSSLT